jgi:SARP family transcriptional regulator, regulator of embCAB operon
MNIGIADPNVKLRFGLRILFEQQPGWVVAGEAADSQELLALVRDKRPDLVLIDWDLPGIPTGSLFGILRTQCPALLVMAMSGREELGQAALKAGADGFVSKMDPAEKLLVHIRELHPHQGQSSPG